MPGIKQFFPVDKQRGSPKKVSQQQILEMLDSSDDDIEMVDVQRAPTKAEPAETVPPPAKAVAAKTAPPPQVASSSAPKSATEVLASIPNVDLPEVEAGAKPNFRQIMERQASQNDGGLAPEIDAAPNCLTGMTFVVTGTLPTLGRDEITSLIKRYGGNVTSSLSGKTTCLVLGEDAGPSKIQKARSLKLKVINEDGFIQLLQAMPADGGSGESARKARARREREEQEVKLEATRLKASPPTQPAKQQPTKQSNVRQKQHQQQPEGATMWTTKYAPHQMSDICGNNAAVQRLAKWLQNWRAARNNQYKGEGSEFRAAMLSGPPGIGKTTAAHLIGALQGFDIVEYNASDTRSKSLLHTQVAQTLNNSSLGTAFGVGGNISTQKLMVVMDEVDGMSAGDRGGVGAMAALARNSNVPLVLICNERNLPKMRPFDRSVFDIPFRRPDASQVRHRLMAIAHAEGLELDQSTIEQLTEATRSDIRQMLNLLETYRTTETKMDYDGSKKFSKTWNKEIVLKPFDIAARLLSRGAQTSMSTSERMELYFHDYDFAPLMIQENYLGTAPSLKVASQAAESISDGDLVDRLIHGPQQQWSLMPLHDLLSCVRPAYAAAGQARGRFNFTAFLGNNSKAGKYRRLLAELRSHMRLKLATNAVDLRLEMMPLLATLLLRPLLDKGSDGIADVIEFMDQYYITKEDWDVVMELGVGIMNQTTETQAKKIPTAVKSAFTRKYNAMAHPLPFMKSVDSKAAAATGRKPEVPDIDDVVAEDIEESLPNNDEEGEGTGNDLETAVKNDKYIKAKPQPKAKSKAKTAAVGTPRAKKPRVAPKKK